MRPLLVLVAFVRLQGVCLGALGIFVVVEMFVATADDMGTAAAIAGLAFLGAAGLLLVARGLSRGRRWGRAPAVVTQLCLLPVSFDMTRGERWYVGGPLLLWAVAVLVLALSPAVARETAE